MLNKNPSKLPVQSLRNNLMTIGDQTVDAKYEQKNRGVIYCDIQGTWLDITSDGQNLFCGGDPKKQQRMIAVVKKLQSAGFVIVFFSGDLPFKNDQRSILSDATQQLVDELKKHNIKNTKLVNWLSLADHLGIPNTMEELKQLPYLETERAKSISRKKISRDNDKAFNEKGGVPSRLIKTDKELESEVDTALFKSVSDTRIRLAQIERSKADFIAPTLEALGVDMSQITVVDDGLIPGERYHDSHLQLGYKPEQLLRVRNAPGEDIATRFEGIYNNFVASHKANQAPALPGYDLDEKNAGGEYIKLEDDKTTEIEAVTTRDGLKKFLKSLSETNLKDVNLLIQIIEKYENTRSNEKDSKGKMKEYLSIFGGVSGTNKLMASEKFKSMLLGQEKTNFTSQDMRALNNGLFKTIVEKFNPLIKEITGFDFLHSDKKENYEVNATPSPHRRR